MSDDSVVVNVKKTDVQSTEDGANGVEKPKKDGSSKKKWLLIGGIVLLVLAIGSSIYFYTQYQDVKSNPAEAITEKNTEETERVMTALKKILFVSETDNPTVARVEDPEKLKTSNAEFYKDVQTGDYLIIFPKRAIIFRESNGQIINIAPIINTSELKAQQDAAAEEEEKPAPATQKTTR